METDVDLLQYHLRAIVFAPVVTATQKKEKAKKTKNKKNNHPPGPFLSERRSALLITITVTRDPGEIILHFPFRRSPKPDQDVDGEKSRRTA